MELQGGTQFFSVPPPGSGALVAFILNILDGYGFNSKSVEDIPSTVTTYHRIIEAFKYAFGFRTKLGDPDFVDITRVSCSSLIILLKMLSIILGYKHNIFFFSGLELTSEPQICR